MEDRTYIVIEICPYCENEIQMVWDTDTSGYKAFCPVCGQVMMLCDECMHSEDFRGCDWREDGCFRCKTKSE